MLRNIQKEFLVHKHTSYLKRVQSLVFGQPGGGC